jgi:hypothetical protein
MLSPGEDFPSNPGVKKFPISVGMVPLNPESV